MKVILYVFSGTGNTLKVANLYKKYLESANKSTTTDAPDKGASVTVDIYHNTKKSGNMPSPENYDLVGIGYPIHGFSAPEPAIKLCNDLPEVKDKPTFFFKTSGEGLHLNDYSSQKCLKILTKKGYNVTSEKHIVMPYNMIYRHKDEMAKQMWIYAHALVDLHCRELLDGKRENVKRNAFISAWFAPVRFLEQKFAHLHGPAFKVHADKCVNCMRCVNVCPQNNIKFEDGKFKFGHDCVLCMGCSFGCPADAISVGVFGLWKVNGSYRVDELVKDDSIPFPFVPHKAKGIYRIYKKYYRECDEYLNSSGLKIEDYV